MGRSEDVCAVVPSSSCPGLPASRQARRRNTSVRSDGLTVIRVAAFGQQNTGQSVSPSLPELSSSGFRWKSTSSEWWCEVKRILQSTISFFFFNFPFLYFWKRRHNRVRFELSHVAMNWVYERKCVLWLESETVLCIWLTSLVVLKSVVRNPQKFFAFIWLMFGTANSVSDKRALPALPTPRFFSLISFGSWAKGMLANRPHSLGPLWLYNELYLNINCLCIWFYSNPIY